MKKLLKTLTNSIAFAAICAASLPATAQQVNMTYEERVRVLEELKAEDAKWDRVSSTQGILQRTANIEKLELPPLSVFLDAVMENATIKRAQSDVEEAKTEYRLQSRDWWNFFRINGSYSFGRYNVMSDNSSEYTPIYQTVMASTQHNFYIGASVLIPLGDIFNRKLKLKKYKYEIEQYQYDKEQRIEERKLRVLEAYNEVTEQLATIKAKAESAALYNAQMKISENDFIQGKITIIDLSLERGRRSGAVVVYEQSRVQLHNAITMLEMLTNVKIIKD